MSGDEYYNRIRQQLETRLNVVAKLTGAEDLDTSADGADIHQIERLVEEYLEELP